MTTFSQGFRSLSIALLAASIFYLGYVLLETVDRLMVIMERVDTIAESVNPVVELAPEFLGESEKLRILAKDVSAEVAAVRLLVPSVLDETAAIRKTLPSLLQQTELILKESERVRAEVAQVRAQIPGLLAELEAYRVLVPQVLEESQRIRLAIPPTLDRVEGIVTEAEDVASSAGENVFTGLITGIVKAPIKLLGNVGEFLLPSDIKLSEADRAELEQLLQEFLDTAELGDTQDFVSSDGLITGQFELISEVSTETEVCREVGLKSFKGGKLLKQVTLGICRDNQGDWILKSSE